MFCPNCGIQIDLPYCNFCYNCGYNFQQAMMPNMQPQPQPQPVYVISRNKLWTDAPAEMRLNIEMKPRITTHKDEAKKKNAPVTVNMHEFKARCEYCYHVFQYNLSNLGYRDWYRSGFVYCPFCSKPLRHHPDLLVEEHYITFYPDGHSEYR